MLSTFEEFWVCQAHVGPILWAHAHTESILPLPKTLSQQLLLICASPYWRRCRRTSITVMNLENHALSPCWDVLRIFWSVSNCLKLGAAVDKTAKTCSMFHSYFTHATPILTRSYIEFISDYVGPRVKIQKTATFLQKKGFLLWSTQHSRWVRKRTGI